MNERKIFIIDPYYMGIAKAIYRRGAYANSSNSQFLRAVLEDIAKGVKKVVTK